ncbi:MAG: polysaccharide biosynthesis tyrosine autokinase [Gammaproteobacteria bacterium]|nr:polysaccharide biosynthesis tyrosine autokinase [Gammaproteobacteria bacterium]MBL7003821.1 polysaccharide biosynthesis tyrosine autokinase [Gammaproteobacteria bacterium]
MVHGDIQTINPLNVFSHQIELDLDKLNKEGFITPKYSNTLLANSYRMIKRPLLNNINGKSASTVDNANLIMVTSSLPGEGKTFSAINLAISMAMEKDKRVLLVDADTNKPSHYKLFGIENRPGLTDFLLNEVNDMGDVLCRTNIPSLSIMSSGKMYEYSTELLASAAMDKFINEISNRYKDRVVIFDSPPLLQTTESSVLAAHMGQIVMVVEAENTQNHMVKKSLSLLSNEIVLLLLNKQREKIHEGHYGYGYGYGHQH